MRMVQLERVGWHFNGLVCDSHINCCLSASVNASGVYTWSDDLQYHSSRRGIFGNYMKRDILIHQNNILQSNISPHTTYFDTLSKVVLNRG